MGKLSRTKGCVFERKVAAILRLHWPHASVHRSSQADRAYSPDVVVEGGPEWTRRLWLELNDARNPNPRAKLEQAERDAHASTQRIGGQGDRYPVIVWHRLAERTIWATLRHSTLMALLGVHEPQLAHPIVTLDLPDFLALVARAQEG